MEHHRVLAICTSRVIFGNERAFRDAIIAIRQTGIEVALVIRDEAWTDNMQAFFVSSGAEILRWPAVDLPLKGWVWTFIRQFPSRFLRANYQLFRYAGQCRKRKEKLSILISDAALIFGFGILLNLLGIRVIYRCGALLPEHSFVWRRVLNPLIKKTVSIYVVDSEFMKRALIGRGIKEKRINVIRPVVPVRS